jgi:hypothetical protein
MKLSQRYELWPYRPWQLSPEVKKFVEERLPKRLSADEKALLAQSEGKWPDYPQTIQGLAKRHSLQVPWQTLPGQRKAWDFYRIWSKKSAERFPGLLELDFALLGPAPREPAADRAIPARLPGLLALGEPGR